MTKMNSVDGIINPQDTWKVLISALESVTQYADDEPFRTGVYQTSDIPSNFPAESV